ncbi:hypothetical protein [Nocardia wallacei]|uniref:hypothetical protein n=1 Tax=Nocardia wallacei TaxID=480035 RepID=UPI002458A2A9|nr:hypothetical protein [Nocardia wallacei]
MPTTNPVPRRHPRCAQRLAHLYTRLGGYHRHFELPDDYDKLRCWISDYREKATDVAEFDRQHEIVK